MRRVQTYVGQQVYEYLFSAQAQNDMVALAKVCAALFGTTGSVKGLSVTQTSVASMAVKIGPGEIYQMESLEATACGTLPADTTHTILKQGIQLDSITTSTFAAPSVSGQSINYLIQAQYQDSDISLDPTSGSSPVVLQFYNATAPATPWSGPSNSGATSNTFRDGAVAYSVVAGVSATTGSQVTPAPSSGWIGIAVVTVAYGATSITNANISIYQNAPILPAAGLLPALQSELLNYVVDTGAANAYVANYSPAIPSVVDGTRLRFRAAHTNTGTSTFNPNGIGAAAIFGADHVALIGGEIVAGSDVELVWNSTLNTSGAWVLLECTGGAQQLPNGSRAVTQLSSDNTTKLATTAFCQALIAGLSTTYLTPSSAAATYETIANANATFETISALASALSGYLTSASAAATYATISSLANYLPNLQGSNNAQRGYMFGWGTVSTVTLPAGGTWFVSMTHFNGSGQCNGGTNAFQSGGTNAWSANGDTSFGFAIKVA